MKILILGSNGMPGRAHVKYFDKQNYEILSLQRNQFTIAKDQVIWMKDFFNL